MVDSLQQHLSTLLIARQAHVKILKRIRPVPKISDEHDLQNPFDLNTKVEQGLFRIGDLVCVKGFFSNYGITYFPLTYIPTVPLLSSHKIKGSFLNDTDLPIPQMMGEIEIKFKCYQLPVENIPSFTDRVEWKIGFLYHSDFGGFMFQEDQKRDKLKKQCSLLIPEEACPLIVIYDHGAFKDKVNAICDVRAQIVKLESDLLNDFCLPLGNVGKFIYRNCFVQTEAGFGVALMLTPQTGCANKIGDRSIRASFLVEGFLDMKDKSGIEKLFSHSVPNVPSGAPLRAASYPPYNDHASFIATTPINFVFKKPNIFSIFVKINIPFEKSEEDISLTREHYFTLMRNLSALTSKVESEEVAKAFFFYFSDPKYRSLFGLRNYLDIKSLEGYLNQQPQS